MTLKLQLYRHRVLSSILLFVILFYTIHLVKPTLFYLPNGAFRQMGVGYKNKTVFPIWVLAIILAIFCYIFIGYLIQLL